MLIHICHNAPTNSDTVKEPKWGSTRSVPMPQAVADELKLVKAMTNASSSFVIFAVMRLAGHRSGSMIETYSHVDNVVGFTAARAAIDSTINSAKVNHG